MKTQSAENSSRRLLFLLAAIALASWSCTAAPESREQNWITTWATANQQVPRPQAFRNQTVREIVHTTIGGSAIRLRLADTFSSQPVTFDAVYLGLQKSGANLVPGSNHKVTFAGKNSVTVREGAEALSDPIPLAIGSEQNLVISLYTDGETGSATVHSMALQTNYVSGPGNFVADEHSTAFTRTVQSWYFLHSVDVIASPDVKGAIVALGDSITDGVDSRPDQYERWPDVLARRLLSSGASHAMSVLNAGISGNRVLSSSPCWGANTLARLDRDVFSHVGVQAVILFEGTNDIGQPDTPPSSPDVIPCLSRTQISADDLIAAYQQIIAQAHARRLKIFGATILPYQGFRGWTPQGESKRVAVNNWIKTSGSFDGVIDFAAELSDSANPARMNPKYDSGDHLHPGPAGHAAMGNTIDLALFR